MFCPNCGNNCADARFCSSCGTQLQQAASAAQVGEWKVGMPCPQCGGTKLDGDCCAFCGAQLIAGEAEKPLSRLEWEDSYDFPYRGFHEGIRTLTLESNRVTIETKLLFSKECIRIYFDELEKAEFIRCGAGKAKIVFTRDTGEMTVFEANDSSDEYDDILLYFVIFYLIKYLAEPETEFVAELPDAQTQITDGDGASVDLGGYFERFCPCRAEASAALAAEHHMLLEEAEPIIDGAFYLFQRELYEREPILAVRDYNRVMADRKGIREKHVREMENRGLKRRRR